MKKNMQEGTKRSIYHELATHNVIKSEEKDRFTGFFHGWLYTFGKYRLEYTIHNGDDFITMYKYNPDNKHFVIMDEAGWDEDYPKNTTYEIYVAARNKADGKEYIDPYKISSKDTIKDSQKRFAKQMQENAADFLPYDTPKDLQQKIITEMKNVLIRNLKKHYNGKNK